MTELSLKKDIQSKMEIKKELEFICTDKMFKTDNQVSEKLVCTSFF